MIQCLRYLLLFTLLSSFMALYIASTIPLDLSLILCGNGGCSIAYKDGTEALLLPHWTFLSCLPPHQPQSPTSPVGVFISCPSYIIFLFLSTCITRGTLTFKVAMYICILFTSARCHTFPASEHLLSHVTDQSA